MTIFVCVKQLFEMKKKYFLFFFLWVLYFNAQEKYIGLGEHDSFITIYTHQKDGNYLREEYLAERGKLRQTSSYVEKIENKEQEESLLKWLIPIASIKTDKLDSFEIYNNKTLKVTDRKTQKSTRFRFYNSHLFFEDLQYRGYYSASISEEFPILKNIEDKTSISEDSGLLYGFQTIENITFFIVGNQVYLFKIKELLDKLFPDSEINFTDKKFADINAFRFLEMFSVNNSKGESLQGVKYFGKEILPAEFEKIIICADAILVKNKDLWYFYDFFGNKIINKGYRKILPLQIVLEDIPQNEDSKKTTKGILRYVVLEKNEIKEIQNIYEHSENSDFIHYKGDFSVCGTRMGSWSSVSTDVRVKNNTVKINKRTSSYNSDYIGVDKIENPVIFNNDLTFSFKEDFGKIDYLNKTDSTLYFGNLPNGRLIYFFKNKKDKKEGIFALRFECDVKQGCNIFRVEPQYLWNQDNSYGNIQYFDKIESYKADLPLISFLGGDYKDYFGLVKDSNVLESNFLPDSYYKIYNEGKIGFYSPRLVYLGYVEVKYKKLENIKDRFLRFEDEKGKSGWLSEDGEEFYDNSDF